MTGWRCCTETTNPEDGRLIEMSTKPKKLHRRAEMSSLRGDAWHNAMEKVTDLFNRDLKTIN
jgi:hypothetical protein